MEDGTVVEALLWKINDLAAEVYKPGIGFPPSFAVVVYIPDTAERFKATGSREVDTIAFRVVDPRIVSVSLAVHGVLPTPETHPESVEIVRLMGKLPATASYMLIEASNVKVQAGTRFNNYTPVISVVGSTSTRASPILLLVSRAASLFGVSEAEMRAELAHFGVTDAETIQIVPRNVLAQWSAIFLDMLDHDCVPIHLTAAVRDVISATTWDYPSALEQIPPGQRVTAFLCARMRLPLVALSAKALVRKGMLSSNSERDAFFENRKGEWGSMVRGRIDAISEAAKVDVKVQEATPGDGGDRTGLTEACRGQGGQGTGGGEGRAEEKEQLAPIAQRHLLEVQTYLMAYEFAIAQGFYYKQFAGKSDAPPLGENERRLSESERARQAFYNHVLGTMSRNESWRMERMERQAAVLGRGARATFQERTAAFHYMSALQQHRLARLITQAPWKLCFEVLVRDELELDEMMVWSEMRMTDLVATMELFQLKPLEQHVQRAIGIYRTQIIEPLRRFMGKSTVIPLSVAISAASSDEQKALSLRAVQFLVEKRVIRMEDIQCESDSDDDRDDDKDDDRDDDKDDEAGETSGRRDATLPVGDGQGHQVDHAVRSNELRELMLAELKRHAQLRNRAMYDSRFKVPVFDGFDREMLQQMASSPLLVVQSVVRAEERLVQAIEKIMTRAGAQRFPFPLPYGDGVRKLAREQSGMNAAPIVDIGDAERVVFGHAAHVVQREAMRSFMRQDRPIDSLRILLGLPGVGKSWAITALCIMAGAAHRGGILLCAQSNSASELMARNLQEKGVVVNGGPETPMCFNTTLAVSRLRKLGRKVAVLVVDEVSMADTASLARLLTTREVADHVQLVLVVGDENQLPPIGHGMFMRSLLSAEMAITGQSWRVVDADPNRGLMGCQTQSRRFVKLMRADSAYYARPNNANTMLITGEPEAYAARVRAASFSDLAHFMALDTHAGARIAIASQSNAWCQDIASTGHVSAKALRELTTSVSANDDYDDNGDGDDKGRRDDGGNSGSTSPTMAHKDGPNQVGNDDSLPAALETQLSGTVFLERRADELSPTQPLSKTAQKLVAYLMDAHDAKGSEIQIITATNAALLVIAAEVALVLHAAMLSADDAIVIRAAAAFALHKKIHDGGAAMGASSGNVETTVDMLASIDEHRQLTDRNEAVPRDYAMSLLPFFPGFTGIVFANRRFQEDFSYSSCDWTNGDRFVVLAIADVMHQNVVDDPDVVPSRTIPSFRDVRRCATSAGVYNARVPHTFAPKPPGRWVRVMYVRREDDPRKVHVLALPDFMRNQLGYAYCTTVHKFQGRQARYVIYVISARDADSQHSCRPMYLVGTTRARERLFVIGTKNEAQRIVNRKPPPVYDIFQFRLERAFRSVMDNVVDVAGPRFTLEEDEAALVSDRLFQPPVSLVDESMLPSEDDDDDDDDDELSPAANGGDKEVNEEMETDEKAKGGQDKRAADVATGPLGDDWAEGLDDEAIWEAVDTQTSSRGG